MRIAPVLAESQLQVVCPRFVNQADTALNIIDTLLAAAFRSRSIRS